MKVWRIPCRCSNEATEDVFDEMSIKAEENADAYLDTTYLDTLNAELQDKSSYLIVRKGKSLIIPEPAMRPETFPGASLLRGLRLQGGRNLHCSGRAGLCETGRYDLFRWGSGKCLYHHLREQYNAGAEEAGVGYADCHSDDPGADRSAFVGLDLPGHQHSPAEASGGHQHIKDGDLDFELKVEGKDEFSGLCRDFEEMRQRLRDSNAEKEAYDKKQRAHQQYFP